VVNDNFGFSIGPEEQPDPVLVLKAATDFKRLEANLSSLVTACPRRSLLDVGCGTGSFLIEAEKRGWHVAGLELSPSLAAYARRHYGFRVEEASIETLTNFPSESFDVISLFGVIEHLAYPRRAIEECARLLRADGTLVLQTPSEDGLIRRAGHFLYSATGGGVDFQVAQLYQMHGGHSVCFSRRSMKSMLEMCGFTVIRIEQSTYGFRVLLHRFKNMKFVRRMVQTIGTLVVFSLGQLGGSSNHMTVYARKLPGTRSV
jgi:SAM-dependent methyltransferase